MCKQNGTENVCKIQIPDDYLYCALKPYISYIYDWNSSRFMPIPLLCCSACAKIVPKNLNLVYIFEYLISNVIALI